MVQALLDERDQRLLLDLGGDLVGMDQPALQLRQRADQQLEWEVENQKERQKDPHRRVAERPAGGDRGGEREEARPDDLGPGVVVRLVDDHRYDLAAGGALGLFDRCFDALCFLFGEEGFCF